MDKIYLDGMGRGGVVLTFVKKKMSEIKFAGSLFNANNSPGSKYIKRPQKSLTRKHFMTRRFYFHK